MANARAGKLPRKLKGTVDSNRNTAKSFQPVFEHAAIEEVLNSPSAVVDKDEFFSKLYSLPSWLRREACATPSIQSILIKEVSSRCNSALIFLYGIMLLAHIITFSFMVDSFASGQKENMNVVTSDSLKIIIFATNLYLSLYGLAYTFTALRLNIGLWELVSNIWGWFTCVALASSFAVITRVMIEERAYGTIDANDQFLYDTSTLAMGMLWTTFIGYLARWWYGISCFCASIIKVRCYILTP